MAWTRSLYGSTRIQAGQLADGSVWHQQQIQLFVSAVTHRGLMCFGFFQSFCKLRNNILYYKIKKKNQIFIKCQLEDRDTHMSLYDK